MSRLVFYDNYSYYAKLKGIYADTRKNGLGEMITVGSVVTYVDTADGRNHTWLSANYSDGLAAGLPDADLHSRFNINISYYF